MAAADHFETVQKLYIAFYQRPADSGGLLYWSQRLDAANGSLVGIVDAFASSAEATSLYGAINSTTIGSVIDSIYQALFDRAADANGKAYYVNGFAAGTFTAGSIALNILNGAKNDDLVAIENKVIVANRFTESVDGRSMTDADFGIGTDFAATYAGDADVAAARTFLAAVTSSPTTVLTSAQVTEQVKASIADAGDGVLNEGAQTFTLTASVESITGTASADTFNALGGRLNSDDAIDGAGGDDVLNATLAAAGNAYLTSVETVNVTALNASAAMDGSRISGTTAVNVSGGGTLAYSSAAAGINYSVAGDGTSLTVTQAGSDAATNSVSVELKAGKLGTLTLGTQAALDYETINLKVNGATSATLTEAGTPTFADTTDKIVVTGSGTFALAVDAGAMGEHATAPTKVAVDATGFNGTFKMDLTTLDSTNVAVSAEGYTGVDQIQVGLSGDAHIIDKVASGTEIIIDDAESDGTSDIQIKPNGSGTTDKIGVTLNHGTAGTSLSIQSITVDGFETATFTSTGTDSATATVANTIGTIAGTATDKSLTIAGDKKLTAGVEATWTNITVTNTKATDLTVAAGGQLTYVGGDGTDRLELDTLSDIASTDSLKGGNGKDTLAISDVLGTDFSTAQLAVVSGFEVLEYEGTQDLTSGSSGSTRTIDLTKQSGINELFLNGLLDTDSNDLLVVKAADNFTVKMGAHDVSSGAATQFDVQITNALTAGTNNTVNLQLVNVDDAGTSSNDAGATNGGLKIGGVEKLTIALLGDEATATNDDVDTYTLSDIKSTVLQDIVVTSANTGKNTDGTAKVSDSLTVTDVESTLLRSFDASGFTGALDITGLTDNFIATGATITGGSGKNTIYGGTGADTITTGKSDDVVRGGTGADVITTGAGNDLVLAATGADSTPEDSGLASLVGSGTAGALAAGDIFTMTVFGKAYSAAYDASVTARDTEGELAAIIATAINADIGNLVTATAAGTGSGTIRVVSKVDGNFGSFVLTETGNNTSQTVSSNSGEVRTDGTNSADVDVLNVGAGTDIIHTAGGADTVDLGAGDLAADTIYVLSKDEGGDVISNFEAGTFGDDVIKFASDMLVNNSSSRTATLQNMTKTGTVGASNVFIQVTSATAAAGADTAAEVAEFLSGIVVTNIARDDAFVLALNDGSDTYLWSYTEGQSSGTIVVAADELKLVGVLSGVTSLADGDLAII